MMNILPTLTRSAAFALALAIPVSAAAETLAEEGERVFRRCQSCHEIGADAENGIGPHLNNLVGREAGSINGFGYSTIMSEAGTGGLVWDAETLGEFLERPRAMVSGTSMRFNGLRLDEDRAAVIAYLVETGNEEVVVDTGDPDVSADILALEGDYAYGQYLASTCVTCHQHGDVESNIPSIFGWPQDSFVTVMHAYKNKDRENNVMQQQAGVLSNEEIAALAAYFTTLK